MALTYLKKIRHSILCVTGVYLRDITNIIVSILHLNVSHLSVCFSSVFLCVYVFVVVAWMFGQVFVCVCVCQVSPLKSKFAAI